MKVKTKVHKYRRNDGTPVRTHTRKIDVDVFKPEKPDNTFENKDDSPSIEIDNNLVQGNIPKKTWDKLKGDKKFMKDVNEKRARYGFSKIKKNKSKKEKTFKGYKLNIEKEEVDAFGQEIIYARYFDEKDKREKLGKFVKNKFNKEEEYIK